MQASHNAGMDNWHNYEVHAPREIVSLLRAIQNKKQLIRMLIKGEADVCVTTILDVDTASGMLTLDCSPNAEQNRRVLASGRIAFETTLDKIRILFHIEGLEAAQFEGSPAFTAPLPASLIRLQRREYYRMSTPVTNPVKVTIPMPFESGGGTQSFPLADISCGGIAMLDHKLTLDNTIGLNYPNCRIDLPDIGLVTMTLQVRNSLDLTLLNNKTNRRLGCEFRDLSRASLAAVQRYITFLERERNARVAGLA